MQRTKAPFRADEVGSLLRPPRIKEARAKLEKGEISADDLRKVEDIEIEKVVHKQASIGLKLATDGEFRRSWWHFDFLSHLTGCELQADRRLLVHDFFDLHVLGLAQIVGRNLALLQSGARLLDARGPQQAADLVGAERGFGSLHGITLPKN